MLWARYEKPYVPLADICEEYFGLCSKRAKSAAAAQELPVPVVRLSDSKKSPYMVKLSDLARYLDSRHELYAEDWRKVRGVKHSSVC
ncbi:pyocin activator PrtN family protein [Parendozoicomonas haliclonae]